MVFPEETSVAAWEVEEGAGTAKRRLDQLGEEVVVVLGLPVREVDDFVTVTIYEIAACIAEQGDH